MGTPQTLIISDRLALTAKAAAALVEVCRAPRWMSQSAGTLPVSLGLDTTVRLFKTVIKPRTTKEFPHAH